MKKQFIGVILLMMGMDNLWNLKDSGIPMAQYESGQWAAFIVSIIMVVLGLYLGVVGWLEFRKTMEQRDREKKEAEGMLGSDAAAGDAKAETGIGNKENDTDKYLN
ncbi:MAG: hypothetical protein II672_03590 [Oscillospiraceae bacterium]|nr:hypothetical protein [Oscillospiraceae bacterium]